MVFVSYDRTGNVLTADYAGEQTETNTYNELGLLTTVTTAEGDTLYQYDDASRLISVTQPNGETVSYTYDSHGNRATMTYPNGKTVKYTYDDMNRLIAVKGVDGETTKYEYDALGRRIATDGAKEDTVYSYDEVGNLVSQTTTGAYDLALEYAYDLSGRMTQESRTENGATLTSSYIYDALGQLTGFTRSDGQSETYTYDPVGNMTAKTQNGVSTAMRYNAANQLISSVSGTDRTTYTYDANGNLVRSENAGGARSYAYNALNLLESFTREDGYTETYSYNANRLLSEIRTSEDLTTSLTWNILYGDGVVISTAQNGETTNYTYGVERISAKTGSTRTEYVYDGRGSVAAEVSYNNAWYTFGGGLARKNVVSKSYSPFGELLTEQTSGFGYNGEYYNAATGMIYLRARFYAPEMNRFGQKDILRGRITDPLSLNRYPYCTNDPIDFCDPSGMAIVRNTMVQMSDGGGSGTISTGSGKNSSSVTQSNDIDDPSDKALRERIRKLAKDTISYSQAAYQYIQANASGTSTATAAQRLYRLSVDYANRAIRMSYNSSIQETFSVLNQATLYQQQLESYWSTALRIAMAKNQHVSPYERPQLTANPSVETTIPRYLPCGKGKYGYGEVAFGGKSYSIAVPSPLLTPTDGGWRTIAIVPSKIDPTFRWDKALTYGLTSADEPNVYAGNQLVSNGSINSTGAAGIATVNVIGILSTSLNSHYVRILIQENGNYSRAVILLGGSEESKLYNSAADGIPRLRVMGDDAICYTVDSKHLGNGYFAYLWESDSGTISGTPIVYQDDKVEVGKFHLFKFIPTVEIQLSTEPFDASLYEDLIAENLIR